MLAAIMQPTFLPWCGYFDLIDQVDVFVFLDTVQFEKQTWQQRNRIKTPSGLEWLTVPVFNSHRFGQPIRDVEIKLGEFPGKHLRALRQHYAGCNHYVDYAESMEAVFTAAAKHRSLACLNIELIRWLASAIGISTPMLIASEIPAKGQRSDRLVAILRQIGADAYRSPRGSLAYLSEDRMTFRRAGIPVSFQTYTQPSYRQRYEPFVAGASTIDLLFNHGVASADILRSGRALPEDLEAILTRESTNDENR